MTATTPAVGGDFPYRASAGKQRNTLRDVLQHQARANGSCNLRGWHKKPISNGGFFVCLLQDNKGQGQAMGRVWKKVLRENPAVLLRNHWTHVQPFPTLEIDATEIRIRAERRLGELIKAQKETVGLNAGAKGSIVTGTVREPVKDTRPTLSDSGISKKLSSHAQKVAAIPDDEFEDIVDDWA